MELLIGADVLEVYECLERRAGKPGQPVGVLTCLGRTRFDPDVSHNESVVEPARHKV